MMVNRNNNKYLKPILKSRWKTFYASFSLHHKGVEDIEKVNVPTCIGKMLKTMGILKIRTKIKVWARCKVRFGMDQKRKYANSSCKVNVRGVISVISYIQKMVVSLLLRSR